MPSLALQRWLTVRAATLDELENAHRAVGGSGPGRHYATQQINQAYALILAGQFQAFCRDLHTEGAQYLAGVITPVACQAVVEDQLRRNRRLNRGNANPENLKVDFERFGLDLWVKLIAADARNARRRQLLDELNQWRNAIAHQDFAGVVRRGWRPVLQLAQVQDWRRACDNLARAFDALLAAQLQRLTGMAPW